MTIEFDPFMSEGDRGPNRRPKRRVVAVVGASMLVAAAGGVGFGLGRAADNDDALTPAAPPETAPRTESPATMSVPRVASDDEPPVPGTETAETLTENADAGTASDEVGPDPVVVSGGGGWTMFEGEAMALLTERTTESGVTVRAHLGQLWEQDYGVEDDFGGPDGWQPPSWCFESGQVRIALGGGEATGASVIDVGSVGWWSEPFEGRAVSALTMGTVDANPYRVVFVQVPASVANVSVAFDDGATDSVAPTNGVALLVVPGASATASVDGWVGPPTDFEVQLVDATGDAMIVDGSRTTYNDPEFQRSCSPPPPELRAPGEQPEDSAADEETIVELMTAIYRDDSEQNSNRFDDPTGIAEAREQVRAGDFEEAAANAEVIVEELVFTSPSEAWFRYRIETTTGTFSDRFGIAVQIDGTWKITRATICQDLSLAGGDCGGDVGPIIPPGS